MIARGWAYRVPRDRPGVRILVSPTEQTRLGHELFYSIPTGDEQVIGMEERRTIAREKAGAA